MLLSEGHFLPKQSVWEPDSGDSRKFAVLENGGVGDLMVPDGFTPNYSH